MYPMSFSSESRKDPIELFINANHMFSQENVMRVFYMRDDLDEVFIVQLAHDNYVHFVFNCGNLVKIFSVANLDELKVDPIDYDEFIMRSMH